MKIKLGFWEEDEEFEEFGYNSPPTPCKNTENCIRGDTKNINSCEGNGAAMVMDCKYWAYYHNRDMKSKCEDNENILVGVLSDATENCQNEVGDESVDITRGFARTDHPDVLKFIKDMKKGNDFIFSHCLLSLKTCLLCLFRLGDLSILEGLLLRTA